MTQEEETKAQYRFLIINICRITGAVMLVLGLAVISREAFGLPKASGYVLFLVGMADFLLVPVFLFETVEEPTAAMRRFWKEVTLEPSTFGHAVRLDGRPVKTPTRNELALPTKKLADAVVAEWEAVEKTIDPAQMSMTGFANAAIDHIGADRDGFVSAIAAYGETDLLCYRAAADEPLGARQAEIWDPWLDWARARYDVSFIIVEGIMHQPQPEATLAKLRAAVAARGTFELAAMAKLAHLSGSLVLTLALVERAGEADEVWTAACLDELWQEELWGADHWADKNRADRRAEFMAAARFLELLRTST